MGKQSCIGAFIASSTSQNWTLTLLSIFMRVSPICSQILRFATGLPLLSFHQFPFLLGSHSITPLTRNSESDLIQTACRGQCFALTLVGKILVHSSREIEAPETLEEKDKGYKRGYLLCVVVCFLHGACILRLPRGECSEDISQWEIFFLVVISGEHFLSGREG